jgi:DNA-binding MltR family transcriptional regulator
MSSRDALRRLSRKLPAPPEIVRIMDGLRDKDDMHAAIMAVSIVEATLERLIVTRLHKSNKELLGRLFQNRGPISDFNAKILIAEAFGIITGPLAEELHSMRAIRNAFAHAKIPISFSDEPVKRVVNAFKTLTAMRNVRIDFADAVGKPFETENTNWFLLAVRLSLILMDEIAKAKGTADAIIEEALRVKSSGTMT